MANTTSKTPTWTRAEDLVLLTYSLGKCVIPQEYECFAERVSNASGSRRTAKDVEERLIQLRTAIEPKALESLGISDRSEYAIPCMKDVAELANFMTTPKSGWVEDPNLRLMDPRKPPVPFWVLQQAAEELAGGLMKAVDIADDEVSGKGEEEAGDGMEDGSNAGGGG